MIDEPRRWVQPLPPQGQETGHGVFELAMLQKALQNCVGLRVEATQAQALRGLCPEGAVGGRLAKMMRVLQSSSRRSRCLPQDRVVVATVLL